MYLFRLWKSVQHESGSMPVPGKRQWRALACGHEAMKIPLQIISILGDSKHSVSLRMICRSVRRVAL
jgi:hypothetical protein